MDSQCVLLVLLVVLVDAQNDVFYSTLTSEKLTTSNGVDVPLTEHPGGIIRKDRWVFSKTKSPYWLRNDILVERNAELLIEPGVTIKVEPQVGITVRGVFKAEGTQNERITLTTAKTNSARSILLPDIRLVDGPSILAGRVQLKHNGKWRSVCTNSKNWTRSDMETACRQLGFQGGSFHNWFNRLMPLQPRLLYEEPKCSGRESSLQDCNWSSRQMGSGVCDYHPDLAIECLPRHDQALPFWRGLRFEYAQSEKTLSLGNTLYVPRSSSDLSFVGIYFAGAGRDQNTSSALHVEGVPPNLLHVEVVNSAYNGVNFTKPEAPILVQNCTFRNNRGYGVFVNSSFGLAHFDHCLISQNGGDGLRFVRAEERPDERADRFGYRDFCQLAVSASQTFPIQVFAEQTIFQNKARDCSKVFTTNYGHKITLSFIRAVTDRNESATLSVFDGSTLNHRLIKELVIRNNTRPQSLTTTSNQIFVQFKADARTNMVVFMRILSGLDKAFDLNVSSSVFSENLGRGIAVDNLRSQLHVFNATISQSKHVAGVHVTSGVGDVNITRSTIAINEGDGINITYTGGNRNFSKVAISSNTGYGIAIWLNHTEETEYSFVNQTTTLQYSDIFKNLDVGVLHGNFCGFSVINVTGNHFQNSLKDALEILTCWKPLIQFPATKLQIGHNWFKGNERLAVKISPAVNLLANIEHNNFREGSFGGLLIKNKPLEEFNSLPTQIMVHQNYFMNNFGTFVVNLALSPYSYNKQQYLLFTRNFVKNNKINEPFQPEDGSVSKLNPRSRVSAPIVVGSDNIDIFRNIIENPDSKYEIGSQLGDQSKIINCTFNWLGFSNDEFIFNRVFHRYDRYDLAKILFIPFLLHNSNPLTTKTNSIQLYVPKFGYLDKVGGEIEGEEVISKGEYLVERDINIRPGGKLTIEPGVTLRFPPSVGMMVGGRLEARGNGPDSIKFTIKEEIVHQPDNETYEFETIKYDSETEIIQIEPVGPIRLLGGLTDTEGRLQIKINEEWGTVCNYGWTIKNAALVCHQLGYVLNPEDWFMERSDIPSAGTSERVLLSNVQCDDEDLDITQCRAEKLNNFENSCSHDNDVGVRCYPTSWAGVRFGPLAERTNIQFITIEKAGLLDYATSSFKSALQLDFARQNFENIRICDNFYHGLSVMYSDIYTDDAVNNIKNSEFSNNKGAGISIKQLGFSIFGSKIDQNTIGIKHNPMLSGLQQRELGGWFIKNDEDSHYNPFKIPQNSDQVPIRVLNGETKYFVTTKIDETLLVRRAYQIQGDPGWVIGIQLLNPIENRSSEQILIHDSLSYNNKSQVWDLRRDLTVFPTTSSSHGIIIDYFSGVKTFGGTVLVISSIKAPVQNVYNRIVKGPIPSLTISRTKVRNNQFGLYASYYNRYLDELGNHFLRKANESIKFINCEISHNANEALFVHSPFWDLHYSNISEVTVMINNSLITDNGKGLYHFSRDMRASNNLFHYILQDNTISRNKGGGFDVSLPYVWQYNENFTHSVYMDNNSWTNNQRFGITIDGHFAVVNITRSAFHDNTCKTGLLTIKGMEKKMRIFHNKFVENNGWFVVEFSSDSQSEIIGNVPAIFRQNELRSNRFVQKMRSFGPNQREPTCVVGFKGVQKVKINRNLFSNNSLDYQLLAGIKTAKIDSYLDVTENFWGSNDENDIKREIFDFDDWNDHAVAQFRPFLTEDHFESSFSGSFSANNSLDLSKLGGRLQEDLTLYRKESPYVVLSDLTIMPKVTLTIQPGVVMEFAPNVGLLVLGTLKARAYKNNEIVLKQLTKPQNLEESLVRNKRELERFVGGESIRLCKSRGCVEDRVVNEGFLEYFNKTTLQWIPMCDSRFTERNAQVVCRELGFESLNSFFDHGIRIDFHSNSLSRIWTWPEPLQCTGNERKYEDCPIRLNGQQFGHRHRCEWNSNFVFIHCNEKITKSSKFWGGVRFADAEFEQQLYAHRIHDTITHTTLQINESILEFVRIEGAGVLHNEKSPAVQSILKSPSINFVTINNTASHGIDLLSPSNTMNLLYNTIQNCYGVGISILSLFGEGRESGESSFSPLKAVNIPYNLFSLVDICDTHKEIQIEERILLYYKYDNHPVNCIKIFKSAYNIKPLGFRLLQFNLFNSTGSHGIADFISLHDGDIYNVTSTVIDRITMTSNNEKKLFKTTLPSLSVKLFANGASSDHGFIAEVVTLPISTIAFNRDVQHNISSSLIENNTQGALLYMTAGEVNPILTIEKTQFKNNCKKLYGNFTTCKSALLIDVQNTQTLFFRNNLIDSNQGGLFVKADSRGSATSLRGWIHNNLFVNNSNLPTLYVEGRQSSPYQEVTIYRNYFTRNHAQFHNNIVLKQVVSNFTYNYVKRNIGMQNLEVSGFDRVRLNIYQTTTHNGFYNNFARFRDSRSTIVAGTAGQHYVDNIFFNPDNDYEMITVNRSLFEFNSTLQLWNTKIDAVNNYWGVNTTLAVRGRIRDQSDDQRLLEVQFEPFYLNNKTILNVKCPPGWDLVGETCYMYVGAPMTFHEAKAFCSADNASVPYLIGNINYLDLYQFLKKQHQWYLYSDKVWVQHIDRINECTMFAYQTVELDDCKTRSAFICEIDPKVSIKILPLADDYVTLSVLGSLALAIILLIVVVGFWWSKSKFRQEQRLERRNSIRQSLHSLRSVGLSSDSTYRRKAAQLSSKSTDTLTKTSDFRKMTSNGSIDSMMKSAYNSSAEDSQSFDLYESHNTNPSAFAYNPTIEYHKSPSRFENQYAKPSTNATFDLGYRNDGFRDNSTFATNSRAESIQDASNEETPIMESEPNGVSYPPSEYFNTDTLPLDASPGQAKQAYDPSFSRERPSAGQMRLPPPPPPSGGASPTYSEQLDQLNYTPNYNIIGLAHEEPPVPKKRSKSEALLETNFDYSPSESPQFNAPFSGASRSKSQPLETAM